MSGYYRLARNLSKDERIGYTKGMEKPDYVEVSRKAHELSECHGPNARTYAAKLAAEAAAVKNRDDFAFWKAVEASLIPR